jgi:succinate-acetate transporter protein
MRDLDAVTFATTRPSSRPVIPPFAHFIGARWPAPRYLATVTPSTQEDHMNKTTFRSFGATLEDLARDIVRACRDAARAIAAMPWPAMLVCCIGLAIVFTLITSVLPLALFLFLVFMALKLVIVAFAVHSRSKRGDDYQL